MKAPAIEHSLSLMLRLSVNCVVYVTMSKFFLSYIAYADAHICHVHVQNNWMVKVVPIFVVNGNTIACTGMCDQ